MSHKRYIVEIGTYDDFTTEKVRLKEISIESANEFEAHKQAFYKCIEDQTVLKIIEATSRIIKFDFQKGFNP